MLTLGFRNYPCGKLTLRCQLIEHSHSCLTFRDSPKQELAIPFRRSEHEGQDSAENALGCLFLPPVSRILLFCSQTVGGIRENSDEHVVLKRALAGVHPREPRSVPRLASLQVWPDPFFYFANLTQLIGG